MRISDWSSDVCSSDLVSLGSAIGEIADGALTNAGKRSQPGQTVAPNRLPTPAVNAIARAPQKVTRMIDRMTGAPPAFAPSAPSRTRHRSETATTSGINCCAEAAINTASGMNRPEERRGGKERGEKGK